MRGRRTIGFLGWGILRMIFSFTKSTSSPFVPSLLPLLLPPSLIYPSISLSSFRIKRTNDQLSRADYISKSPTDTARWISKTREDYSLPIISKRVSTHSRGRRLLISEFGPLSSTFSLFPSFLPSPCGDGRVRRMHGMRADNSRRARTEAWL